MDNNQNNKTIRLEMCDNTFWTIIIAVISIAIVGIIGVASYYHTQRLTAAFNAGYEEAVLPGRGDFAWQKHEKKP